MRAVWVPVQSKYIMELDILMSRHQTHGQVVKRLHQFDYGIVVLRREGAGLRCVINSALIGHQHLILYAIKTFITKIHNGCFLFQAHLTFDLTPGSGSSRLPQA